MYRQYLNLVLICVLSSESRADWLSIEFSTKEQLAASLEFYESYFDEFHDLDYVPPIGGQYGDLHGRQVSEKELNRLPYAAVGKFFAMTVHGELRSCTAFFVDESIVMTAAHCMMETSGHWRYGMLMATRFGAMDVRLYSTQCAAVTRGWSELPLAESLNVDYAFAKVHGTSQYLKPADTARLEDEKQIRIVGYLMSYSSHLIEIELDKEHFAFHDGHPSLLSNPMYGGGSGSPWINSRGKVLSLTSRRENNDRLHSDGPVFDRETFRMLKFVKNGCK